MRLPREYEAELCAHRHTRRELQQALVRGLRGARMPVALLRNGEEPRHHLICDPEEAALHLADADVIGIREAFGACVDCLWSRASGEACTSEELLLHAYEAADAPPGALGDTPADRRASSVLLVLARDRDESARVRELVRRFFSDT